MEKILHLYGEKHMAISNNHVKFQGIFFYEED